MTTAVHLFVHNASSFHDISIRSISLHTLAIINAWSITAALSYNYKVKRIRYDATSLHPTSQITHSFFCTSMRCLILALKLAKKIININRITKMVILSALRGLVGWWWLALLPFTTLPPGGAAAAAASAMVLFYYFCKLKNEMDPLKSCPALFERWPPRKGLWDRHLLMMSYRSVSGLCKSFGPTFGSKFKIEKHRYLVDDWTSREPLLLYLVFYWSNEDDQWRFGKPLSSSID